MTAGKRELRARVLKARNASDPQCRFAADLKIVRRVTGLAAWRRATVVLSYLSVGSEVSTRELIGCAFAEDKVVALPRCVPEQRRLRWFAINSLEGLERGLLGIPEPAANIERELFASVLPRSSIALVPGLAFDRKGRRLGYGGGYYDVFLSSFGGLSVGLCRTALLDRGGELARACEPHDRVVDVVVTECATFLST